MYIIEYGGQNDKILLKIFKLFRIIQKKKYSLNFLKNLGGGGVKAPLQSLWWFATNWRSLRFPLLLRLTLLILLKWTLILHPMAQTLYPCMELNSQNRRYHHNRIPDRNSLNHWYRCVQTHCRTPDRNARIPISHFQNRM